MRREFSNWTKAQAALRAAGHCEGCTRKLLAGDYHYDHRIPDAMGGSSDIDNCQVLCKSCHSTKTRKKDVPEIAKAKRRQRAAQGIRRRSTFACSRDSRFKKKIDGSVVLR